MLLANLSQLGKYETGAKGQKCLTLNTTSLHMNMPFVKVNFKALKLNYSKKSRSYTFIATRSVVKRSVVRGKMFMRS